MADLILASASPRRKELLQQIGVNIAIRPVDIDETVLANESAKDYVVRLAREKAEACHEQERPVLGSDTCVVVDDEILGKPQSKEAAIAMLTRLSGRSHEVFSGVAIRQGTRLDVRYVATRVTFKTLTAAQIEAYVATEEPMDKAGSYGIQGMGAVLVERIHGSFSNVVGLPLETVAAMLDSFSVPYWQT
ncbi:septum formation inhibitor Maf [Bermanella marisrubri]|uniref:dTTP/UTP pyrophosphatase n=1 Tax=Bermanella marisrubri TaxID=207949 RepID=Q1MYL7_9GAMM|nr:Maf family protein [Bermanella marisrubri]EAT11099.1 Maf-like protein [Oceanobacter sp. RED65] [Bermanella marisrubri]QIZ83401.1 septum formation inhibitor Maf [Bermanella marisrubri]